MKKKIKNKKHIGLFLTISFMLIAMIPESQAGENYIRIKNLTGKWRFTIGTHEDWQSPDYNDESWEEIAVPAYWENQGFHGYNGYATYRKTFTLPESVNDVPLYLYLGWIDDVDETYLNGHKIGSTGTFPPEYQSAYNAQRVYVLPKKFINYSGVNVIAVKVYDSYQMGGIAGGDIGIYTNPNEVPVVIDLQGKWKFQTGDKLERSAEKYNDLDWKEIFVPGKWEDQGFRNYDGYAWYRKMFFYKGDLEGDQIVLFLGKIDDIDEVYVNGVKVGSTGEFSEKENVKLPTESYYSAMRGYVMDAGILHNKKWNTIAVRVYDSGGGGGIYEGPVGFLSQDDYIEFWRKRKKMISQ